MRTATALVFSTVMMGTGTASAATITFEEIPGFGAPSDGQTISTEFFGAPYGLSFFLINDADTTHIGSPKLAQVGPGMTAFAGPPAQTGADTIFTGVDQGVGNFFLTDDGIVPHPPIRLLINYADPVIQASGQMLDVDSNSDETEAWLVQAFGGQDGSGGLLDSFQMSAVDAGAGQPAGITYNTGDGTVTPFMFSGVGSIESLIITYTGVGVAENIGFAFDNFSWKTLESCFGGAAVDPLCPPNLNPPTLNDFNVPEPSTVTLSLLGLGYVAYRRHRQTRKNVA